MTLRELAFTRREQRPERRYAEYDPSGAHRPDPVAALSRMGG
jgi:hypothetical protein